MTVRNPVRERQEQALPSTMSPEDFAKAMQQLDLSTIPVEKRAAAIRDHMLRIMGDTLIDPAARAEAKIARTMHRLLNQ